MDLNAARAKQRAAQQQAQTQPEGVTRIGDRDPLTGSWYVQLPDGGIGANGIKTYTAMSKPGDVVVLFPRADGSIALDSEKGSPTIVPDVFNKPVPEVRKAKVWILYEANGRLFVGGYDSTPVDVGVMPDPHSRPNYKFHVWGDNAGWIATWESCPRTVATFHTATNDGTTTTLSSTTIDLADYDGDPWPNPTPTADWSFPLGAGFKSFRSIYYFPNAVADPSRSQVSIGYLSAGIQTISDPFIVTTTYSLLSAPNAPFLDFAQLMTISNPGTIKIPNTPSALTYAGEYSSINWEFQNFPGVILENGLPPTAKSITIQSIYHYGILCDRSSTYYIKETVEAGSTTVNRLYELFSSSSNSVIARNILEPKFFGIRWDLRAPGFLSTFDYNTPIYYHSDPMSIFQLSDNRASEPTGYYRESMAGHNPLTSPTLDRWKFYEGGTPVSLSGGSVVKIPALEIDRARFASGTLSRIAMSPIGVETNLSPVFCHQIPFVAQIKHWSTTA